MTVAVDIHFVLLCMVYCWLPICCVCWCINQ